MSLISHYNDLFREAFGGLAQDEALIHAESEAPSEERGDDKLDASATEAAPESETESEPEAQASSASKVHDVKLKSILPSVSDDCWSQFVRFMITARMTAVSDSNAVGMFEMMPRRLADLGYVQKLMRSRSPATPTAPNGRTIWVAVFVPPMTSRKFLRRPDVQYQAFGQSMKDYANRIDKGEIKKEPEMSMSGALAILHRCGPNGLKTWASSERFPATQAAYDKVAGLF